MTIYTSNNQPEKKQDIDPEVVLDTLVEKELLSKKDEKPVVVRAKSGNLTVNRAYRRRLAVRWVIICLTMIILSIAILGGVYIFWRMQHKERTYIGRCGVKFSPQPQVSYQFEEELEIDRSNGIYEKIQVPSFQTFRQATILHDFQQNLTAIIDKTLHRCFIMPLNRKSVKPPKDLWDLLNKLKDGYYLPNARMVRIKYRVIDRPIENVEKLGYNIWKECQRNGRFKSYRLAQYNSPYALSKRSVTKDYEYSMGSTGGDIMEAIEIVYTP